MKKSELKKLIEKHGSRDIFMIMHPVKLNIWNLLFHKKETLNKIETNYLILANEKYMLIQELGDLIDEK